METIALASETIRKKPNFDTEEAYKSENLGLICAILSGLFLCIILNSLSSAFQNKDLVAILIGLFFASVIALQTGMGIKLIVDGESILIRKGNWIKHGAIAQAMIVDRKEEYCEAGYYGEEGYCIYKFALKTNHIQAAPNLAEQVVWANVSKRVYADYAHQNIVRLYYSTTDPLSFLIEGE